jgi:hypothetical protein
MRDRHSCLRELYFLMVRLFMDRMQPSDAVRQFVKECLQ